MSQYFLFSISFIFTLFIFYFILKKKEISFSLPAIIFFFFIIIGLLSFKKEYFFLYSFYKNLLNFTYFLLLMGFVWNEKEKKSFLWAIFIFVFISSLKGFYQYFFSFPLLMREVKNYANKFDPLIFSHILDAISFRRVFSFFGDPNIYALILNFAIILSFEIPLLLFTIFNIFFIGNLVLTFSRMGWISLFIFLLMLPLWYWWKEKNLLKNKLIKILITIVIFFVWFYISTLTRSNCSVIEHRISDVSTVKQRLGYWKVALIEYSQNPFLGNGFGSYELLYSKYKLPNIQETKYAHNFIFQTLAENGVIGTFLISLFFFFLLRNFFSHYLPFFITLVFLLSNLAGFSMYNSTTTFLFALILSLFNSGKCKINRTAFLFISFFVLSLSFYVSLNEVYKERLFYASISEDKKEMQKVLFKWNKLKIKDRFILKYISDVKLPVKEKIKFLKQNKNLLKYNAYCNFLLSDYYLKQGKLTLSLKYGYRAWQMYPLKRMYIRNLINIFKRANRIYKVKYFEKKLHCMVENFK